MREAEEAAPPGRWLRERRLREDLEKDRSEPRRRRVQRPRGKKPDEASVEGEKIGWNRPGYAEPSLKCSGEPF